MELIRSGVQGKYPKTVAALRPRQADRPLRFLRFQLKLYICVLAVALASACEAEPSFMEWEAERRVAGDTTTVHTVAGQVWSSDVQLKEDLVIGVLDGPAELMFGDVSRLAEDLHGGIYVLDAHGPEIRHFDRTGQFIGTVGRSGEGPGEYGRLSLGMVVDSAGVLHMHDWGNGRIVRFTEEGRALDSWTLDSPFLTTGRGTWVYTDASSRLLITTRVNAESALVVLQDARVVDTLTVPQLQEKFQERGGPYLIESYWTWHPEGYFVVGVNDEYSFEVRRPDGVLRIRRDVESLPVHPEEADAWQRHFEWMEQHPSYRPPEGVWMPSTMPPFRDIEVAKDGRIWVQRNTHPIRVPVTTDPEQPPPIGWAQPFVYDVFEPDGPFLGQVRFPERFEPHLLGAGYVWGVRRGDLEEEYVVRFSVIAAG